MDFKEPKFKPQLMRGNAQEASEENEKSLKERYEKKKKTELTVERKPVSMIKKICGNLLTVIGILFAVLGLITLIHPELRFCLVGIILQFFTEAGLL